MSDEFGPFRVGEVVLLTIPIEPMGLIPGDEVTIASEYGIVPGCHEGWECDGPIKAIAGWLLKEQCRKSLFITAQIIVKHGEVKRKPGPYEYKWQWQKEETEA